MMENNEDGSQQSDPTVAQRAVNFARRLFTPDDLFERATRRSFDSGVRTAEAIGVRTGVMTDRDGRARGVDPDAKRGRWNLRPDDKVQKLVRRSFDSVVGVVENVAIRTGAIADRPNHVGDGFHVAPDRNFDPRNPADVRRAGRFASEVRPLLDAAVARFEKAPAKEVLEMLGSPEDREIGLKIAASGPVRRNQIRQMTLAAFSDQRLSPGESKHSASFGEATRRLLRDPERVAEMLSGKDNVHDANRRFVGAAVDRVSYVMEGGSARDRRIATETDHIMKAPDFAKEVDDRFAGTPKSDLRGPPVNPEERRSWVESRLRMEAQMLSKGLVNPHDVMLIASAVRGPVPADRRDASVRLPGFDVGTGRMAEGDREASASMRRMSDIALRHRFRDVPGIDQTRIEAREVDRDAWIMKALATERTRQVMKDNGIADASVRKDRQTETSGVDVEAGIQARTLERSRPTAAVQASFARANGQGMA